MKKFILIIFCYSNILVATASNDFEILRDLDIESSYVKDDKFQTFYESFSNKNKKNYETSLIRGQKYTSEISTILKKNNIPSVFLYMAMAESNFVLDVKSKKNALGLWQFMPETAIQMGLKRNRYVDERIDFVKSTEAAAKYLNKLHGIFGSWYLVAISYNSGDGRLIEGLTRATIDLYCKKNDCSKNAKIQKYKRTLTNYEKGKVKFNEVNKIYEDVKTWNYKPKINDLLADAKGLKRSYIPPESKNYIKKIISLAMMKNNNADKNTKRFIGGEDTQPFVKVEVNNGELLKNVANFAGVTSENFKQTKTQIKENEIAQNTIKTQSYGTSSKLIQYNNNQNVKIKTNEIDTQAVKMIKDNIESLESTYVKTYVIKKGENLYRVAIENGVTMEKIMKDNNLKTNKVKPGDKIVIKLQ